MNGIYSPRIKSREMVMSGFKGETAEKLELG
jgi:hypothetical protein